MKYKAFKTLRGAEVFMAKNAHNYQMELLFVENGYEVEYRPMRLVINWDKPATQYLMMDKILDLRHGAEVRDTFSTKAILTLIETPKDVFIEELGETDGKYLFDRLVQYLAKVNGKEVDLAYVKEFSYYNDNPTPNSGATEVEQAHIKRQADEDAIGEELALIRANRSNRKEVA